MFTRENHQEDIDFLLDVLDTGLPESNNVIGHFNIVDNKLKGFCVIGFVNYYNKTDIEIFIVGTGSWLSKYVLNNTFTYIFDLLGCKRCTVRIANKNKKAITLATKLNFVKEGDLRGLDTGIYSLLKEECKYYG